MISRKQIQLEREGLLGLKSLVEVYEEVAAGRMQKVRGAVVQSRQFLSGLVKIFRKVRRAYLESIRKHEAMEMSTLNKNGRVVSVLVAANSGLYGDIVERTFDIFAQFIKAQPSDVVVLGKQGAKIMGDRLPQVFYNYFDFPDDRVEEDSFELVMKYLIQFERIVVFHGQFRTILVQEPVATGVSGEIEDLGIATEAGGERSEEKINYLFEPSPADIARVFEGEIIASIFEQTLHESQLAKFASRLLALDRSIENIDTRLVKMKHEGQKLKHKLANRKQLSTLSGVSLWSYG